MEEEKGGRRELERQLLDKVGCAISLIDGAKNVDEVIVALYSLAACIFPLDHSCVSGSVNEQYREELQNVEILSEDEKTRWWGIFYRGRSFLILSKVLLYDIACNWLACFPASARKHAYDVFFLSGYVSEVIQVLVPCLQSSKSAGHDPLYVSMNAERLIELCFLENDLVLQMVREVARAPQDLNNEQLKQTISRVAQLVTSIPDKVRRGASTSLSAHLFYQKISSQLLHAVEHLDLMSVGDLAVTNGIYALDATFFIGKMFARICRRGYADVLLTKVIPRILEHIRTILISTSDPDIKEILQTKCGLRSWSKVMEAVDDSHSLQRIAEEAMHQLVLNDANDIEGYWVLWVLFGRMYNLQISIRSMFLEKFLLWKVFPLCCLRWIIHFAVFQYSPDCSTSQCFKDSSLLETVQRLIVVWSRKEFLQSQSTEQQAYVTAVLGLCLEKMSKEDLNATEDGMRLLLQGISCRLESPENLIRKMASAIAFVFSKIINPENPLYLDDTCEHEAVDWEFGLSKRATGIHAKAKSEDNEIVSDKDSSSGFTIQTVQVKEEEEISTTSKPRRDCNAIIWDPDDVIDPAELNKESSFDEYENGCDADGSEASSGSLQPYDLTDDGIDVKRKVLKLVDLVASLRKSDDYEAVENALDIAEKLIRAAPDELKYIANDLVRCLVQVRCSDITAEGEEEPAEEKRQKALVALIVTCPPESLDCLNKMLYTPNLDISQRIMILEVMTDAAQELASSSILTSEHPPKDRISSYSSANPWFTPGDSGPPGAGPWKEISSGSPLNWAYSYERELPSKASRLSIGKTRRPNLRTGSTPMPLSRNCFPQYAAAFMLPSMQGFDKKRHGVDLLDRDFIVLGKLIHMLGVCIKCAAMHPEVSVLASPLLSMLECRAVSHHAEAYVRRSVLLAASCVLSALHPSYVASALVEGNVEISEGLEWVRTYALEMAESEVDRDCHTLAMACLQLHAEMALRASRALESSEDASTAKSITLFPGVSSVSIKMPR